MSSHIIMSSPMKSLSADMQYYAYCNRLRAEFPPIINKGSTKYHYVRKKTHFTPPLLHRIHFVVPSLLPTYVALYLCLAILTHAQNRKNQIPSHLCVRNNY